MSEDRRRKMNDFKYGNNYQRRIIKISDIWCSTSDDKMAFKFEKLRVWQKSLELSTLVHHVTREFPKEELFILTSQIKRAADSVNLNIAEGSTGQSNKEFIKFLRYSLRSNIEVVSCIFIAKEEKLFQEKILIKYMK